MISFEQIEDFTWDYTGVPLLVIVGVLLSINSKLFQIRKLPEIFKIFVRFFSKNPDEEHGVHPLKVFLASVGGCVGIGNIVGICTAVQLGGPGALFWIWVTAILGMILKYAEVYLGVKYRIDDGKGGYTGGPMIYIKKATKMAWVPALISILLCIYGVEILQFRVILDSIALNWPDVNYTLVTLLLLAAVVYAASGGVERVGNIATAVVPIFVFLFLGMGLFVIFIHLDQVPSIFVQVFKDAFTGSAAIGGFAGSSILMAISHGVRRGCYSGDIGIGYASVIHSETSSHSPAKQASLAIVGIALDTFVICTMSVLLILISGAWHEDISVSVMVQRSLEESFPMMSFFMPLFMLLLGYSTINAYFVVGIKCAEQLSPRYGRNIYFAYAIAALLSASYLRMEEAQAIMAISGGFLLVINAWGIYKLRAYVSYDLDEK